VAVGATDDGIEESESTGAGETGDPGDP